MSFSFFIKIVGFHFYIHSKIERKVQRFPVCSSSHCVASAITIPNGTFVIIDELHWHTTSARIWFALGLMLGAAPSLGLDKSLVTWMDLHSIAQSSFMLPLLLRTTDLVTGFLVVHFESE